MSKKNYTLSLAISITLILFSSAATNIEEQIFYKAVATSDLIKLQQSIPRVDLDKKEEHGKTALMIAAEKGHFEVARFLLWSGADPDIKDTKGKKAIHYLSKENTGFNALNLLLRSHSFSSLLNVSTIKPKTPHMVVIDDNYIDHSHPKLKASYYVNEKEKNGKKGIDDDGNGFTDDIYGWNTADNTPLTSPLNSLLQKAAYRDGVKKIVQKYQEQIKDHDEDDMPMQNEYTNPLSTYAGYDFLASADIYLDDLTFYKMIVKASHGTHVAGIIDKNSNHQAKLHGLSWSAQKKRKSIKTHDEKWLLKAAKRSDTYAQFYAEVREEILNESIRSGKITSKYLKQLGAGVVNMSYGIRGKEGILKMAEAYKNFYKEHGKNPASIDSFTSPSGLDLTSDLALELLVAKSAKFAITVAENPHILFVVAAGNDAKDNDIGFDSPAYLSRFFKNVITVASVDNNNNLSRFSNYGKKSVQIATLGEGIKSSILGGHFSTMSGTSMAAPKLAGVVARIRKLHPNLTPFEIRRIIGQSCNRPKSLSNKLVNGGILNPSAAIKLANNWQGPSSTITKNELLSIQPIKKNKAGHTSKDQITSSSRLSKNAKCVIELAGFNGGWAVVTQANTNYSQQVITLPSKDPYKLLNENYSKGFRITASGGDVAGWTFCLSQYKNGDQPEQRVLGFEQDKITNAINDGFAITSIAGWQDDWLITMTKDTGLGHQRYTIPSDYSEARIQWIKARWAEGYYITSIAGDSVKDKDGSWVFVMSKKSPYTSQTILGQGPWPTDKIETLSKKGFSITSVAGYTGNWVIVLSKSNGAKKQSSHKLKAFPIREIQSDWSIK